LKVIDFSSSLSLSPLFQLLLPSFFFSSSFSPLPSLLLLKSNFSSITRPEEVVLRQNTSIVTGPCSYKTRLKKKIQLMPSIHFLSTNSKNETTKVASHNVESTDSSHSHPQHPYSYPSSSEPLVWFVGPIIKKRTLFAKLHCL
jgi:hypothetical protein